MLALTSFFVKAGGRPGSQPARRGTPVAGVPGLTSALQGHVRQGPAAASCEALVTSASSPESVPFRAAYASVERRLKKVGEPAPPVPAELRELARPHFGL